MTTNRLSIVLTAATLILCLGCEPEELVSSPQPATQQQALQPEPAPSEAQPIEGVEPTPSPERIEAVTPEPERAEPTRVLRPIGPLSIRELRIRERNPELPKARPVPKAYKVIPAKKLDL